MFTFLAGIVIIRGGEQSGQVCISFSASLTHEGFARFAHRARLQFKNVGDEESGVLAHLYSAKPPCLIFHRTALASINDATASPHSAALPMKNYSAEFCQI